MEKVNSADGKTQTLPHADKEECCDRLAIAQSEHNGRHALRPNKFPLTIHSVTVGTNCDATALPKPIPRQACWHDRL
ncbi:hypothetical protein H6F67_13800 [Microcoleus sp. FACHB-1515]|uniref:hypothetical protein n=1 Tax=Cyanophyceae TaxID=3028117 RepID=UPI0016853C0F|nr:hypothetical protein [Microcoleus sp. FACHB-1515]MBD2090926.1 hypothetical protein [Microcoleus sp. FACHB-1515]